MLYINLDWDWLTAHSHENGAIFNLIFYKHTTRELGWQFAYNQYFLKVSNNI